MKKISAIITDVYDDVTFATDHKVKGEVLYYLDPDIDEDIYLLLDMCYVKSIKVA